MSPSDPRPAFRPDLEGLRGLAVLLVVAYHAGVPGFGGAFVGVDVFFVLSGYFTTRLLVREYATTGAVDVGAFYARRALRLVPALLVVLAATLALAWALYAPIDRAAVADAARAAALGNANHAFARGTVDYFGRADSPLLHTWSLGVETQLSLAWPALFALLAAGGAALGTRGAPAGAVARRADGLLRGVLPGLAAIGLLSLGAAVWLTRAAPAWAFFGTAARAWEFALGGLLAVLASGGARDGAAAPPRPAQRWLALGGLTAVAAAAALYSRTTPYPGVAALLPALGAAALVAGGGALGVLAAAPLRWFGRVSYGWYLWHWPLMVTGAVLDPGIGAPGRLLWAGVALGLAALTVRWVERPLREGAARAAGPWAAAGVAAACLAVAAGAAGLRASAERRAARPDQRAYAAAREDGVGNGCWASYRGKAAGALPAAARCAFGDPRAARTVALFGDSHAQHWLAALDRLGRERGFRVEVFVMGGCPVADAPELAERGSAERGAACARFRDAAVRRIIALRPAAAVLSSYDAYVAPAPDAPRARRGSGTGVPADAWRRGLRRTYARLAAAGVPVVALRGTPTPGFDAPACLSRRAAGLAGAGACTYARAGSVHSAARAAQADAAASAAARGLPVRLVDMGDVVCSAPQCAVSRGGVVVFTDDNHLTAGFARAAAPALGARLDAALASLGARLP